MRTLRRVWLQREEQTKEVPVLEAVNVYLDRNLNLEYKNVFNVKRKGILKKIFPSVEEKKKEKIFDFGETTITNSYNNAYVLIVSITN